MTRLGLAAAALTLPLLAACSSDEPDAGDRVTCDELADDAVEASQDADVQLLKVREPRADLDKQDTGWDEPEGTDEVLVLRCVGRAIWSDATDTGIRIELNVDADGDAFVFYKPTY